MKSQEEREFSDADSLPTLDTTAKNLLSLKCGKLTSEI